MASEILSVSHTAGVTNSESVLINGVSGHTYTILSILITETAGAAETVDLYIAKMAGGTDGNIISYDASGDPVAIATGTDGQVLTSKAGGEPAPVEVNTCPSVPVAIATGSPEAS
jgi:hypothetical protein